MADAMYAIVSIAICLGAPALAALGYKFQIGTAWTDAADMILRLWCGFLLAALFVAWSAFHFKGVRRQWMDREHEGRIKSYVKHHLPTGQIIPNEMILPILTHVGVAYFAAGALRYDLVVMVLLVLVAFAATVHEMRKTIL